MANILQFLNFADPNALLTNVMLPFLLIFVVVWGILNMTKIFGHSPEAKKINVVIALVMTIFAALTDFWGLFAQQITVFLGQFAIWAFVVVFVVGVIIWAFGRTANVYDTHWSPRKKGYNDVKKIDKELGKLGRRWRQLDDAGKHEEAQAVMTSIAMLEDRKKRIVMGQEYRNK